ncbi:MAG TPA: dephospho-CoA kinase, partial [Anaerolineales bacterium]|nr:dephospho-CoA kinase [Anaerolineales bacterium]
VHPLVHHAVQILIQRSRRKVIAIEAIKLLESDLKDACDAIWVTWSPQEIQMERLIDKRSLSETDARLRIESQPPQEAKVAAADLLIRNDDGFEKTWDLVLSAWKEIVPQVETGDLAGTADEAREVTVVKAGEMSVERARPSQAREIAELINTLSRGESLLTRADVMAAFGEKAFLILHSNGSPAGLVGWQVENLVARTIDVYLDGSLPVEESMQTLMGEVERTARDLQCEASLLFLPEGMARERGTWSGLGYQASTVEDLGVRAWQEAAQESMPHGTVLFFKRLREDRILRPV